MANEKNLENVGDDVCEELCLHEDAVERAKTTCANGTKDAKTVEEIAKEQRRKNLPRNNYAKNYNYHYYDNRDNTLHHAAFFPSPFRPSPRSLP